MYAVLIFPFSYSCRNKYKNVDAREYEISLINYVSFKKAEYLKLHICMYLGIKNTKIMLFNTKNPDY